AAHGLCCICRHAAAHGTGAGGDSAWHRYRAAQFQAPPEIAASQHNLHTILGDLPASTLDFTANSGTIDEDRIGIVDMDKDTPCRQSRQRKKRTIFSSYWHVAQSTFGFFSCM